MAEWQADQPPTGSDEPPVRVWVEKTIVKGRLDREQGADALGKALWSPKQAKGGADIYHFMRDVKTG